MTADAPKTAEIHFLPAAESRRDLCGHEVSAKDVLQHAIDIGITDVVLVGRRPNGKRHVASCTRDMDRAIGILHAGIMHATRCAPGD